MHRYQSTQRYVRLIMTFTAGLWLLVGSLFAQTNSGNVFGHVYDKDHQVLPGVTVTLTGNEAPQTFVTDSQGQFRFVQLAPGTYTVTGDLSGFGNAARKVVVSVGNNTEADLTLSPAVRESITVSAATPVVDTRQITSGANIDQTELKNVPNARDPWVVLQTVPSVLMDRVNVGGDKSGQQSYFVSKGVESNQSVWNINGVQTEDMSGSHGSGGVGFYVDYDSFEEFGVVTGTSDPSVRTPGAQMNLVTKRGTNVLKGSARYFYTGKSLQDNATLPAEAATYGLTATNSINRITEEGLEVGGPIIRDRLWLWGAYSQNPINLAVSTLSSDPSTPAQFQQTKLTNWNGKLNAQFASTNAGFLSYTYNNKTVAHRGIGPTRPLATSYNQTGPGWVYSLEDTQNFSSSFYLTGRISSIKNGYKLDPVGGANTNMIYDENGIPQLSYWPYSENIPQKQARIEGSKFFNTGNVGHELKFGFGYRKTPVSSYSAAPGTGTILRYDYGEVEITRPAIPNFGSNYGDAFVGDTAVIGNATLTGGLRYDRQRARNNGGSVPGDPDFPDLMPGGTYAGDARTLQWTSVSPRIGMTYSLGADKRTVLKAAYNRYVDALGAGAVGNQNPFYRIGYLWYYWDDTNGDGKPQESEFTYFDFASNFDPSNPTAGAVSTGRIDYGMHAPRTNEFVLGAERELLPSLGVGVTYTYRKRNDVLWTVYEKHQGAGDFYTPADYTLLGNITGTLPNGQGYSIPNYALAAGVPTALYTVTTNRPDYYETYSGLEFTATKRMQNHWMMRGNITLQDWKQHVGAKGVENGDPTPLLLDNGCATCTGSEEIASSGGEDGYINSKWTFALTNVFDLPAGFSVSSAITGRQGYLIPYYRNQKNKGGFGTQRVLVAGFDSQRLSNVYEVDLRGAKKFSLRSGVGLEVSADLFNALDQHTVLWRDNRLYSSDGTDFSTGSNQIQIVQSPRIWRLGARITF